MAADDMADAPRNSEQACATCVSRKGPHMSDELRQATFAADRTCFNVLLALPSKSVCPLRWTCKGWGCCSSLA